jgi:hypothetical protein
MTEIDPLDFVDLTNDIVETSVGQEIKTKIFDKKILDTMFKASADYKKISITEVLFLAEKMGITCYFATRRYEHYLFFYTEEDAMMVMTTYYSQV